MISSFDLSVLAARLPSFPLLVYCSAVLIAEEPPKVYWKERNLPRPALVYAAACFGCPS